MAKKEFSLKKAKDIIRDIEYYSNGLNKMASADVSVKRVSYDEISEKYIADVTFHFYEDKRHETQEECEYPIQRLKDWIKVNPL